MVTAWLFGMWLITLQHDHAVWFAQPSPGSRWVFLQAVPFWTPAALMLVVTMIAWRLDTFARRRARLNLFPKCNYDRTGLASDVVCPECGTL